jgi:hypothetical protein
MMMLQMEKEEISSCSTAASLPATFRHGPRCNLTRTRTSHELLTPGSIATKHSLACADKVTVLSEPCDLSTIYCALVRSVYCRPTGRAEAWSARRSRMRRQSRLLLRIGEETLPRLVSERRQATTVARVRVG